MHIIRPLLRNPLPLDLGPTNDLTVYNACKGYILPKMHHDVIQSASDSKEDCCKENKEDDYFEFHDCFLSLIDGLVKGPSTGPARRE